MLLLKKEFPKIYWSPCVAHYIDLMLQDFGKFEGVSEIVSHALRITKYIYNHYFILDETTYMWKRYTPSSSNSHIGPKRCIKGHGSTYAKVSKAKKFVDQILDFGFWKWCADMEKLTKPLVRRKMVRRFRRNKRKMEPYLEVLDRHWDSQLHKDLYATGYWLNPACRFNAKEFEKHRNTQSGILELIDRYTHGDLELPDKLNEGMRIYKNSGGDFARRAAIREWNIVMLDQWWDCYGCSAPELEKLSIFEQIHSKRRNRLEHQKLNDLVYVRYNLRLQQKNQIRQQNYDPTNLKILDDHLGVGGVTTILNSDVPIDKLNLDNNVPQPPDNTIEDVNPNESNIGEDHSFDEEGLSKVDQTLAP
ncbi:hypothetical protein HKD37_04G009890 [Glycine soja]